MVCFFHSLKLSIQFDFQFLFVCLFFCLDRQSRATFPTNQIQTKTNGALVDRVFPHFRQFVCVNFKLPLASCVFSILLIGSLDSSGFCLTRFSKKPNNSLEKVYEYQV